MITGSMWRIGTLWPRLWPHEARDGDVIFTRLDREGEGVGEPIVLGNYYSTGRLVWNGSEFGAVWEYQGNLYFVTLDENGMRAGPDVEIFSLWPESLQLFWDVDRYAVAWNEFDPIRGENYFLSLDPLGVPMGERVLISDPDSVAEPVFVNKMDEGYTAVWGQWGRADSVTEELVLANLDRAGNKVGQEVSLEPASIQELVWNGQEYGAIVQHQQRVDSGIENWYNFAVLSQDGNWEAEELLVAPVESYAWVLSLHWHGTGFGLLWTGLDGEDRETYYTEIRCRR